MIRVDPARRDALIDEYRAAPLGPHSPEMQKVLQRLRWGGVMGKPAVVVTVPYREWGIAIVPTERGEAIVVEDERFDDIVAALCAVFRRRLDTLLETQHEATQ